MKPAIFCKNIYIKSKLCKVSLDAISLTYMPSTITSRKILGKQLSIRRKTKNLMKLQCPVDILNRRFGFEEFFFMAF